MDVLLFFLRVQAFCIVVVLVDRACGGVEILSVSHNVSCDSGYVCQPL